MSVYVPRAFALREPGQIARLLAEYPFATLITPVEPEPWLTHLPLQFSADGGPHGALLGHVARANPHWQRFGEAPSMALFHGPHSYVSPSWYGEPASAVPTWNYAVVHVRGKVELVDDERGKRSILDAMIERYERPRAEPWRLRLEGAALDAMLGAIVAFRLVVDRVEAKFKLSQNRSDEDRGRVIRALRAEAREDAVATAEWMERYAREP